MAEIIENLTLSPADSPYFVADNTVYSKPVLFPGAGSGYLINGDSQKVFKRGDNFTILSVMLNLPEGFTFYKDPAVLTESIPRFVFQMKEVITGFINMIPCIGTGLLVPAEGMEVIINGFTEVEKVMSPVGNFRLHFTSIGTGIQISTKLAPAAFNGKTFIISPIVKVSHNQALT